MYKRPVIYCYVILCFFAMGVSPVFGEGHQGITDCFVCHDFYGGSYDNQDLGNLRWVKGSIAWPEGSESSPVAFTALSTPLPYDGTMADGNDVLLDGPCEVCHTQTAYHTNTGDGTTHFDGENCLTCHPHFPDQSDYFSPVLPGPQSHETHLTMQKGPMISDCSGCHSDGNYSLFSDGKNLAETSVCDPCHSPDGVYDGVDDQDLGAKPNWETGIYVAGSDNLVSGKENWCATCHDDGVSMVDGTHAPNVMGDGTGYSYYTSGHGRGGIDIGCASCHDFSGIHTDGQQRTYRANLENYTAGYRLLTDRQMSVPRSDGSVEEPFALCTSSGCHSLDTLYPYDTTNFKDLYPNNFGLHEMHLGFFGYQDDIWDSDWNGKADSAMSCTACHNVHGSPMRVNGTLVPNPVMIRHGELMSTPGNSAKVPAFDFQWRDSNGDKTNVRASSTTGSLLCGNYSEDDQLIINQSCVGCHESGRIHYEREPYEVANASINTIQTTDVSNNVSVSFAPGEKINCYTSLSVTGMADSYYIDTDVIIRNADGAVDWSVNFGSEQTYPAGTYEQSWSREIPVEAIVGTSGIVSVTVRMYDAAETTLLRETTDSLILTIDEGLPAEHTVSVENVRVTDLSDNEKDSFSPGEDIRCHVRFSAESSAANYYIDMKGKLYNKTGDIAWKTNIGHGETLSDDTYERYWDGIVPVEAVVGTKARLRFKIKMYDEVDGDFLVEDTRGKTFSIEEAAPPEDTVIADSVWTTDLSNNEKTSFLPGEDIRCHVEFTVDGLEASSNYIIKGKISHTGGEVEWKKTMKGEEILSDGTYQRSFDSRIPADAMGNTDAVVQFKVKMVDSETNVLTTDSSTTSITIEEEVEPDHMITIDRVWTTDLSDVEKTAFAPEEKARYHVEFTVTGIATDYFVDVHGKATNTTGDIPWKKVMNIEETLSPGTYIRFFDKKIPPDSVAGTSAKVRFDVDIYDGAEGSLLSEDNRKAEFEIVAPE